MNYIIGTVISGAPVISSPSQLLSDIATQFGGTWTSATIIEKSGYTVSDGTHSWVTHEYTVKANSTTGKELLLEAHYDSNLNQIYRGPGQAAIGAGGGGTCSGCDHCMAVFDDTLKTTHCDCLGAGSCSLSNDILT